VSVRLFSNVKNHCGYKGALRMLQVTHYKRTRPAYVSTLMSKGATVLLLFQRFLPRDAKLARCMLSSCVRLSLFVRPSVTSRYGIETTGRIEPVFGFLPPIPPCVMKKFG